MQTRQPRIVIVGGGFAGVNAAQRLARRMKGSADIVLVSDSTMHTFTPWLYEIASGNANVHVRSAHRALAKSADVPIAAALLRCDGRVRFRHATVTGLDLDHRHVLLAGGHTLQFDALIIALGSEVAYFGIPGMRECALPLKTSANAAAIHRRVRELVQATNERERKSVHVLIGGAGPIGVELAGELATMARGLAKRGQLPHGTLRITLIDAVSRVLSMTPPKVSLAAERRLRSLGVEVMLDTMVIEAHKDGVVVRPRPQGADDTAPSRSPYAAATRIDADLVVWAGGVKPNGVLEQFAVPKDPRGRIRVTPTFEVYGHPHVFALGDCALLIDPATNQPVPQTAHAAEYAAPRVADNVIRALAHRPLQPVALPKRWPLVVTVGGRYGVANMWGLACKGWIAYALRRAADFRYFWHTLPHGLALRTWWRGVALYRDNDG
ncbi:NAD(P)/FAD-dependent oxidoreductase [Candidatus Uhrbacteria bacterium]|nr:NAD(P)/FAD-dependent oxidoreductase [Candidatus Uhrbacteria bacterium]